MNKRSVVIYGMAFFIIFIIEFGLNSYLSYKLSINDYLFYQNTINILPFFTILVGLGTPYAVVYLTSLSKNNNNLYLFESNLLSIVFFIILLVLFICLYCFFYLELYFLIALVLGFFNSIKQNVVNYFLALKKLNVSTFVRINQKIIYLIIIVLFINIFLIEKSLEFGLILILAEFLGFVVLYFKYDIIKMKKFTKATSILKISKYSFFANLFSMLALSMPLILLNTFNYSELIIVSFAISYMLLKYVSVLLAPFMQLVIPYFSPYKNNLENIKPTFFKLSISIVIISICIYFCILFSFEYIIDYFFDSKYIYISHYFSKLIYSIPFLFINSFFMIFLASVVTIKYSMFVSIISFIFITLFSYIILNMNFDVIYLVYLINFSTILITILSFTLIIRKLIKGKQS